MEQVYQAEELFPNVESEDIYQSDNIYPINLTVAQDVGTYNYMYDFIGDDVGNYNFLNNSTTFTIKVKNI